MIFWCEPKFTSRAGQELPRHSITPYLVSSNPYRCAQQRSACAPPHPLMQNSVNRPNKWPSKSCGFAPPCASTPQPLIFIHSILLPVMSRDRFRACKRQNILHDFHKKKRKLVSESYYLRILTGDGIKCSYIMFSLMGNGDSPSW